MVGQVFLAYQTRPKKWRIFKYRRWKKKFNIIDRKPRVLKYR